MAKIDALYAYGPLKRYGYVRIQGVGWKRLWADHDSQIVAMMAMAAQAKAQNKDVTIYEKDGKIRTMYVW